MHQPRLHAIIFCADPEIISTENSVNSLNTAQRAWQHLYVWTILGQCESKIIRRI